MTNDEWNRAAWYHRAFAVIVANMVFLSVLAALVILALLGVYFLTAIPLKIYLAAIVIILLVIVLRNRPRGESHERN